MPQQTDSALPTKLASVSRQLMGRKVRVAGRILVYDQKTTTLVLVDGEVGVAVDVSLCLDGWTSGDWLRERLSTIMVIGHLERANHGFVVPERAVHGLRPRVDATIVLKALLVTYVPELDLGNWNSGIDELQADDHDRWWYRELLEEHVQSAL